MLGHSQDWMIVADKLNNLRQPRKIVEYKYVMCDRTSQLEFEEQMKEDLKDGWQPYGSPMIEPAFEQGDDEIFFWQAMVKYE